MTMPSPTPTQSTPSSTTNGSSSASSAQTTDKIGWTDEIWARIHDEVHHELTRARVVSKCLPTVHVHAKTLSVPADVVSAPSAAASFSPGSMTVDEGLTLRINEFWTEFVMTPAQVAHEAEEEAMAKVPDSHRVSTGVTLATRAANLLAQAEDMLIVQGANALFSPLFGGTAPAALPLPTTGGSTNGVYWRGSPVDLGLLNLSLGASFPQPPSTFGTPLAPIFVHPVGPPPTVGAPPAYQYLTVAAVAQGCSALQAVGQCGPYALILQSVPWADTLSPLPNTLILPAIPIKELVTAGFLVTGALPPWNLVAPPTLGATNGLPTPTTLPPTTISPHPSKSNYGVVYSGVLLSLGGHPFDLVRCRLHPKHDALVSYEQTDANGNLHFRIRQRFALRLKDITAVVPLLFLNG